MARRHFAIAALLLAIAAPLRAQSATASVDTNSAVAAQAPAGPTYDALTSAARTPSTHRQLALAPDARGGSMGQAKAMMIVGVAGLLAGAVIGGTPGTIIMIGGAVVGLVGLYEYLE